MCVLPASGVVGGSCVSVTSDYGTGNSPLIRRYTSIPESDVITIYMGTNDYGHETPMGTIDDMEDISFYGALNVIIPGIQKEVCEKYDVPVIDLFTLSGMDPSLSEVRTQYMPDGLHPNAAGHEKIAAIIAKSLEGILVGK